MKQTDSTLASVRGWGCHLCVLAYIAGVRDIGVVDRAFSRLVSAGMILDNQVPTSKGGWYRSFILKPGAVIEQLASDMGRRVFAKELSRHTTNPEPSNRVPGFFVIKEVPGHFGLIWPEIYNPDPRYPLSPPGVSYRVWAVGDL